jgi:hypothetical protein
MCEPPLPAERLEGALAPLLLLAAGSGSSSSSSETHTTSLSDKNGTAEKLMIWEHALLQYRTITDEIKMIKQ